MSRLQEIALTAVASALILAAIASGVFRMYGRDRGPTRTAGTVTGARPGTSGAI